ncbi:UNVERIFIED_CONTAM: hypothetical protein Sangu_3258000 [Sesamum angustifolium]|uniref:Reverse transcriptase domain-containing protein n=1 Tax=Sesamum angustifolium TaxID=2727405 RepID=A0AAW2JC01_9LAMI
MHELSVFGACGGNLPGYEEKAPSSPNNNLCPEMSGHKDPKQHDRNDRNAAPVPDTESAGPASVWSRDSVLDKETRVSLANVQRIRRNLLVNWSWFDDYSGPAGRIWLVWNPLEVGVDILRVDSQFITVEQSIKDCTRGDFNAVMDDSEVCGRAADTSMSMTEFRTCVRDTGLVQLPATGCPYTWHNCSEGPRSLWKRCDENAIFRFDNFLTRIPAEFRKQKKLKGNLTTNVMKAKAFLDKAQALFTNSREDIYLNLVKCCRRVYSVAVKLEISMLQQRAKLRWLKHGDQNSKVFFRKINASRVKQRVYQIKREGGELLTAQNEAPVTRSEVKDAIFDIDVESAPGPDGYTSEFYRAAWSVLGQDLYKAVAITKIMVKRIHRILPLMIDNSQNAFVPGRSITDNILLAQELLAGYNQMRLPNRCTLKVDIQKAYDSVKWISCWKVLSFFTSQNGSIQSIGSSNTDGFFTTVDAVSLMWNRQKKTQR